jgi:hypothetical protein
MHKVWSSILHVSTFFVAATALCPNCCRNLFILLRDATELQFQLIGLLSLGRIREKDIVNMTIYVNIIVVLVLNDMIFFVVHVCCFLALLAMPSSVNVFSPLFHSLPMLQIELLLISYWRREFCGANVFIYHVSGSGIGISSAEVCSGFVAHFASLIPNKNGPFVTISIHTIAW